MGQLFALRDKRDDNLCVILYYGPLKNNNQQESRNQKKAIQGWRKQQSTLRKPRIPPSHDPRDHKV